MKTVAKCVVCTIFSILSIITLVGCVRGGETGDLPQEALPLSPGYSQTDRHEWFIASARALELWEAGGVVLIDVRGEAVYAAWHVSGAINVHYDEIVEYAEANLPDKDALIITYCFCGGTGGTALTARNLLAEAGYTNVFYTNPEDEWEYEGTSASEDGANDAEHRIVSGAEAKEIVEADDAAVLLDVRNQDEYDEGHVEDSILIPLSELESRLSELPDKDAAIIVYCRGGVRSAAAYEILVRNGYTNVYDMQMYENWP